MRYLSFVLLFIFTMPAMALGQEDTKLALTAYASTEVQQDTLRLSFYVREEGDDSASVQAAINARMKEAQETAKAVDGVEVSIQGYHVRWENYPRGHYPEMMSRAENGAKKPEGRWVGQQYVSVSGKNFEALQGLGGTLQAMGLQSSGGHFYVSNELREQTLESLIAPAVQKLFAKAKLVAEASSTTLSTASRLGVGTRPQQGGNYAMMEAAPSMRFSKGADSGGMIVVEPGKETITQHVYGDFLLNRVEFH